jgi:hypothetical protein
VQNGWVTVEELPDGNLPSGQSFVFNLRREKFQDPRVREAIGLMFNFEWSNETLFYGLYERTDSFWGNSDMQADGPAGRGRTGAAAAAGRRRAARRLDPDRPGRQSRRPRATASSTAATCAGLAASGRGRLDRRRRRLRRKDGPGADRRVPRVLSPTFDRSSTRMCRTCSASASTRGSTGSIRRRKPTARGTTTST